MTGERLHSYTRKRLATMARQRQVPGWHEMRKSELIDALLADEQTLDRQDLSDAANGQPGSHASATARATSRATSRRSGSRSTKSNTTEDRLTASAVSPEWMRAEWSISAASVCRVESAMGQQRRATSTVLRLFEISDDECQTHGRIRVSDTEISLETHEWFVRVDKPGRVYRLQLGMRAHDGEFYGICGSNPVEMPDCEGRPDAQTGGATEGASPLLTSARLDGTDVESPFRIEAEVILRGRAEPKSVVTVDGEHVPLRPDGTFDWTLALLDGRHVLPAVCTSRDGRREQTVVLALERNTKRLALKHKSDF